MRAARVCLLLAVAALLATAWPASADAYRLEGRKWPKRTITYHDAGPDRAAVRLAAQAWNRSGVRIRLKPASRRRAHVRIRRGRASCWGFAQIGYARGVVAGMELGRCADLSVATHIAAHEFGHILGLGHEERRCATMSSIVTSGCKDPPPYLARCRVLQRDDVRGAIRRYGGRLKSLGPDLCPRFAPPSPPTSVRVTGQDGSSAGISAQLVVPRPRALIRGSGSPPPLQVAVYRHRDRCPAGPPTGRPLTTAGWFDEPVWIEDRTEAGPGRQCYAFWTVDLLGRRSAQAATVTVDVVILPPRAQLDPLPDAFAGEPTYIYNPSQWGESGIAAYRWTFGDGGTSTEESPSHTWAAPGTYTVTLTVTDPYGRSSTASRSIRVVAP